jgi:hypothetical protein
MLGERAAFAQCEHCEISERISDGPSPGTATHGPLAWAEDFEAKRLECLASLLIDPAVEINTQANSFRAAVILNFGERHQAIAKAYRSLGLAKHSFEGSVLKGHDFA